MGDSLDELPAYLLQPPVPVVGLPAEPRIQELPYESIGWENFERLCLRCAQSESDVERAHLYGVKGQAQYGIDLYARLDARATFVRLLADCNGLDAAIREQLLGTLDGELAMEEPPAVSFDLFLNRRRTLALTLLDVLAER
jgi:hypothetical protein